jgi:hypothetical protein
VPLLAFHRQTWDVLRPYSTLTAPELADLRSAGASCAAAVVWRVR